MKLTAEQLDMLEKLGENFFSFKESAIVLEVPLPDLKKALADSTTDAYKRYYKGKFTSELELRDAILKMAKRGSSPHVKTMLDILQSTELANI